MDRQICNLRDRFVCPYTHDQFFFLHTIMRQSLIFITFALKNAAIASAILKENVIEVIVTCALNDKIT